MQQGADEGRGLETANSISKGGLGSRPAANLGRFP